MSYLGVSLEYSEVHLCYSTGCIWLQRVKFGLFRGTFWLLRGKFGLLRGKFGYPTWAHLGQTYPVFA